MKMLKIKNGKDLKKINKGKINKYKNLVKVMQLPGTTMDKEAKKLMSEYAKNPENFLKDVNEMMMVFKNPELISKRLH